MGIKHKILSEKKKKTEKPNKMVRMVMPIIVHPLIAWN